MTDITYVRGELSYRLSELTHHRCYTRIRGNTLYVSSSAFYLVVELPPNHTPEQAIQATIDQYPEEFI